MEVVVERCAALDVHKDTVMACVRRPGSGSKRDHEVREFRTYTATLRDLRGWLVAEGVTAVAMGATGVYWRPVWAALEDVDGVELLLVNAHHVKNLPGRKTSPLASSFQGSGWRPRCLGEDLSPCLPRRSPSARRLDGSVGGSGLVTISEFGDPGIPPVLA